MNEFLKDLKFTIDALGNKDVPSWIHRYHRKLSVACLKEARNQVSIGHFLKVISNNMTQSANFYEWLIPAFCK